MSGAGGSQPPNAASKEATPAISTSQDVSRGSTATPGPSRVVGNQAKRQEEVTRHGTTKMKFVPTIKPRRAPVPEVKQEDPPAPKVPAATERGRGRGRGIGMGRGRGAAPPPRKELEMVASGPFAMGPAMAGAAGSRRRAPRSNFALAGSAGPSAIGSGLSNTAAPILNHEKEVQRVKEEEDVEVYSDPDEGVQIVDMGAVKTMDWMAPESLRREKDSAKKAKQKKMDALKKDVKGKAREQSNAQVEAAEAEVEKNLANALDLSESEEEEEMEDLIEDFAQHMEDEDSLTRQEKLYFFQFPHPFPTFTMPADENSMEIDVKESLPEAAADKGKKVSFAENAKPVASTSANGTAEAEKEKTAEPKVDGIIGQLEVHQSGMIKMRLENGMVFDVTAATQPSFLQHAVYIESEAKKLYVLGEVNRRFVVSPDTDKLLQTVQSLHN